MARSLAIRAVTGAIFALLVVCAVGIPSINEAAADVSGPDFNKPGGFWQSLAGTSSTDVKSTLWLNELVVALGKTTLSS